MGPCRHYFPLALALLCVVRASPARAQSVQFSPNPFTFVPQAVGSPSASSKHLSITNSGALPLVITSATITGGDFSFSTGNTLDIGTISPGATFTAVVLFRAAATGLRSGTLVLQDNASNSPQILSISSQGFNGAGIQAPDQDDGIALATATVGNGASVVETITSSGNQNVAVTGVGISGPGFSQTNNCSLTLSPGATCNIQVTFNPTLAGSASGALTISNTGFLNPLVIPLSGNGGDFSIILAPGAVGAATIKAGQAATFQLHLTSPANLPGATTGIVVTCSNLPPASTCNVTQTPDPEGFFTSVSIGIVTTGRKVASAPSWPPREWPAAAFVSVVAMAMVFGAGRRRRATLVSLLLATALLGFLISCGANSSSSSSSGTVTPPGSYNVTITAARGTLTHTFTLTVNVQ